MANKDKTKPEVTQPPIHLQKQLIVAAALLIIGGVVIIVIGKLIIGGILSLLGAVFGLGSQVVEDLEL